MNIHDTKIYETDEEMCLRKTCHLVLPSRQVKNQLVYNATRSMQEEMLYDYTSAESMSARRSYIIMTNLMNRLRTSFACYVLCYDNRQQCADTRLRNLIRQRMALQRYHIRRPIIFLKRTKRRR